MDPAELTPGAALRLAVDLAIENGFDAVMFAGDVVESTNARFEAMAPLEERVRRLLGAGIEVFAVAGNHDVEALPRLAGLIEGFHVLGAGGRWEARTISKNGIPVAQVAGWSFGQEHVRQSPVAELLKRPLPTPSRPVPRIGLLHADLGAPPAAPMRRSGRQSWMTPGMTLGCWGTSTSLPSTDCPLRKGFGRAVISDHWWDSTHRKRGLTVPGS